MDINAIDVQHLLQAVLSAQMTANAYLACLDFSEIQADYANLVQILLDA